MKKRLSFILALTLLCAAIPALGVFAEVTALAGSGTVAAPFQIGTEEELVFAANCMNAGNTTYANTKVYRLVNDITLTAPEEGQSNFPMITSFGGTFDGGGHKISDFVLTAVASPLATYRAGFFATLSGTVGELFLENASVNVSVSTSSDVTAAVGILVGEATSASVIKGCRVTGSLSSPECFEFAGGVIGRLTGGKISDSFFDGTVKAGRLAGGIIGYAPSGATIERCLSMADITINRAMTGSGNKTGAFIAAYFSGSSKFSKNAAFDGIIKYNGVLPNTSSSSSGAGSIFGNTNQTAGLTEKNIAGNTIQLQRLDDSSVAYLLSDVTSKFTETKSQVTVKTADEMQMQATYEEIGWDFVNRWEMYYDDEKQKTYPVPKHDGNAVTGDGSQENPYQLANEEDLLAVTGYMNSGVLSYVGKYYQLTGDIELTAGFPMINSFSGVLDGCGHKITGLSIKDLSGDVLSTTYLAGFVKSLDKGIMKNLSVTDAVVTIIGTSDAIGQGVGILAGEMKNGALISNCYVTGTVDGYAGCEKVGGIAGMMGTGTVGDTIQDCFFDGTVKAKKMPGGIISYAKSPSGSLSCIQRCIAMGELYTQDDGVGKGVDAGLIIAYPGTLVASIQKCVAYSGGINYSGTVSGFAGRVFGYAGYSSIVSDNLANTAITVAGNTVTGYSNQQNGQDKTWAQLQNQNTYEAIGWNFDTDWKMSNAGYPIPVFADEPYGSSPVLHHYAFDLYQNETAEITASAAVAQWQTSDDSVAIVDENGTCTAIGVGKAIITAVFEDSTTRQCYISVIEPDLTAYPITVAELDDGKIMVSSNIENNAPAAYTPAVAFAVYDNAQKLLGVQMIGDSAIQEESGKLFTAELNAPDAAAAVKLFVWKDMAGFTPLTQSLSYDLNVSREYVSAIANGTDNNALTAFTNPVFTFRTYVKPVSADNFHAQSWRFWYSNARDGSLGNIAQPLELGSNFRVLYANVSDGGTTPDGSVSGALTQVTYDGGLSSKTIAPGEQFWSDAVDFDLEEGHYLCFTWVLELLDEGGKVPYSAASASRTYSYIYSGDHGEQTENTGFGSPHNICLAPNLFAVQKDADKRLAFLGDSITHGTGSTLGTDGYWVAKVAAQLSADGVAVKNNGVSGACAFEAARDEFWLSKVKGANEVSIMLGTNDINYDRTKDQVINDLKKIIASVKEANPKAVVTLFTVSPFHYDTAARQTVWVDVNSYIREMATVSAEQSGMGADYLFDGCPLWSNSETDPWVMKTDYKASTSDYHPNDAGSAALADAYLAWYVQR